ncbi:MAG: two-component system phosphate regulon sensor histidine kinase PhoR, partial [Alteromonadaceae bacterium]
LTQLLRQFESTISALPYATVTLNDDMEIVWANDAAKTSLGIHKIRDTGQRFDNLLRDPALQAVINTNANSSIQLVSPVNPAMTLMVSCVIFGDNQRLITAKDISQILSVQKLRKAFIANASHELRTPLTVIAGYLEIMASTDELSVPMTAMINNASEQANRMQSILADLLTLSKLEEHNQVYPKDSGDSIHIATIINALVNDIQQTKSAHTIEQDIPQSLYIRANESEVFSLCQNLITNAVKYSAGRSTINIKCHLNASGAVIIDVKDAGEGIAPEHLSRLTERFYRVNATREHQVDGTGLGLSIVKHVLENHGGHLKIHSTLGKGSVFSAHFPSYRVLTPDLVVNEPL